MIDGGMKGLLTGDDSESSAVALSHQNNVLSVFHPHASGCLITLNFLKSSSFHFFNYGNLSYSVLIRLRFSYKVEIF